MNEPQAVNDVEMTPELERLPDEGLENPELAKTTDELRELVQFIRPPV